MSSALWIAQCLVLSPLAIAVHRYVLLDEVTPHYALSPADQRFQRYFDLAVAVYALGLSIALWFIAGHFIFGAPRLSRWGGPGAEGREWVLFVCFAGAAITGFIILGVTLKIVILFPAIAIDALGAGWWNAMDDSRGHLYRIFWTLGFAFSLPLAPLSFVVAISDPEIVFPSQVSPAFQTIGVVLNAVQSVLIVSAFSSIASQLYMTLGRRLCGVAPAS